MNLTRSVDFLLENASEVIKYRLHKDILMDVSPSREARLLESVMATPDYRTVESYVKPNGYIGIGMHSPDRFMQTPLQDGEAAARLLSYYGIPKSTPIVENFIRAMRDDDILRGEFTFYPPAFEQFEYRYDGLCNGTSLMVLMYAMQAMLGCDDEYVAPFLDISLKAFDTQRRAASVADFAKVNDRLTKRFGSPYYIDNDTPVACAYHLAALAYTSSWRTDENVALVTDAVNNICRAGLMDVCNGVSAKFHGRYGGSLWLLLYPLKPYTAETIDGVMYRRVLTELAMLGTGRKIDVLDKSADNLEAVLECDGVLRWEFTTPYMRSVFRKKKYPTAYCDVWLEYDNKKKTALECDLTFWAVRLLHLMGECEL